MNILNIEPNEIIHEVKISCKIPDIIKGILTRKVINLEAQKAGINVSPHDLQQTADSFRLMNQLHTSAATWSWLDKQSLSLDEFEEYVYSTVVASKLAQNLFSDRVETYFVERQLDYTKAVIYEALFEDEGEAIEMFYSLSEGEISFHEVAQQYNTNIEQRRMGGYLGKISRSELTPVISAAVFASSPPQILKPLVTAKGIHLIFVEEFIPPKLSTKLRMEIITQLFSDWLETQLNAIEFKINIDDSCDNNI